MSEQKPLRVSLIGAGRRAGYLYAPIIRALPHEFELVSVWSRTQDRANRMAEELGVPCYTDVDRLIRETAPDFGVVVVSYPANGQVGLMTVEAGLNAFVETPIAHKLTEADAIIDAAKKQGVKIEAGEQFHRRPAEQLKLKLLASGLFGKVYCSFNDYCGHGYHGVSQMRSYIGFDQVPTRVTAAVRKYQVAAHWSILYDHTGPRTETQEHALVDFQGGQLGIYHWTGIGYDSGLRWWRSSRFMAEKGMGIQVGVGLELQEWLSLLSPDKESPQFITVERRWERCDGGALVAMIAHTGDPELPTVRWDNPVRPKLQGRGQQWHDDDIAVACGLVGFADALRSGTEPEYGPEQARLDQEITLAVKYSSEIGGEPVSLPLDRSIGEKYRPGVDGFDDL